MYIVKMIETMVDDLKAAVNDMLSQRGDESSGFFGDAL